MSKDKTFGSDWNDPKARLAGGIPPGGYDFQRSSTEGPDPAAGAAGKKVSSTKNLPNES